MPSGVIFVVYIPSSNYEHILRFGKPKDLIPVEDTALKPVRLAVELRNKKSRSIPIHLTQHYYSEGYNQPLENIDESDEVFTMENVSAFIRIHGGCQIIWASSMNDCNKCSWYKCIQNKRHHFQWTLRYCTISKILNWNSDYNDSWEILWPLPWFLAY